jgi:hypothetical protein
MLFEKGKGALKVAISGHAQLNAYVQQTKQAAYS